MQPIKQAAARGGAQLSSARHATATATSLHRIRSPFICNTCLQHSPSSRTFSTTGIHLKKSASNPKSARKTPKIDAPDVQTHIPNNKATKARDAEIDPYDHSTLQSGIDVALTRLKDSLLKTRDSAGRISPTVLESLPVELGLKAGGTTHHHGGGSPAQKVHTRLGDIASVVPKGGRTLQIFAAEESHVKPLMAALRASEYSLAPEQAAPTDPNPLCITIPIPPVTAETRQAAAAEAKKLLERANGEIRNARGDAQKRFRRMEIEKLVLVDELRKAHKGMEEVAREGNEQAKKVYEGALKALER